MNFNKSKFFVALAMLLFFVSQEAVAQDGFKLKDELVGKHPRILFTQEEADARAAYVKLNMQQEWKDLMNQCKNIGYPSTTSIPGQRQWWYFSRLGIGAALSRDPNLITKAKSWLDRCYQEDWNAAIAAEASVGLDVAHKLAGFALLYDCLYNDLDSTERVNYEELLKMSMVKFRTRGYDLGAYWTNDYQNNHMHFRATASLYCAIILIDKYPELQSEADYVQTVWERILHMSPHDGSNHEGLNYANYGGQMLYPGIHGLAHCTEFDPTANEHYQNVGYYYIYHVVPDFSSGFGFGDAANAAAASGPNYLFQIANFTQDPYIQYLAHRLTEEHSGDFFLPQWPVLFNDADLEQRDFSELPLHRYFDDIGIVICRSSWDSDATAVAFKCGPMGGHLLNETRGTEYSHYTDYVNVAHDDPDAGTFLLFSKGAFLTTGDGYEKTNKVTTQHSTFIVDDETQYGGGGAWSQPRDLSQYAWQKEFSAVNERIVFSGDMIGVYPDMEKLNRTFVSHNADYFVIMDDAVSETANRTFEWRLQTEGELSEADEKTYNIVNGEANALAKILAPADADWSVTTNKIGNILRARLDGQETNKFLVILWPNTPTLDMVSEQYDNEEVLGVKVLNDGQSEYTLFQKQENQPVNLDDIKFDGNTLLLFEDDNTSLAGLSLVNGTELSYKAVQYFSSEQKINFGIAEIAPDKSKILYSVGPSSGTTSDANVAVTVGGLSENTTYYLIKEGERSGKEFQTDENGEADVIFDVSKSQKYLVTLNAELGEPLGSAIFENNNFGIELYPNPSDGLLNIKMNNEFYGDFSVRVFSSTGENLHQKEFKKASQQFSAQVDLSNQERGFYFVAVNMDGRNFSEKIILN